MTANATRGSASSIWSCYPNYVTCQHDHLIRFHETGYRVDLRRVSGHAFLECRQCSPSAYFLAVFSTSPDPHATCYAICKESYDEWQKDQGATTLSTPEMLYRLRDPQGRSYNPHFQPRV